MFKASYDKANRSSLGSYRGPGLGYDLEAPDFWAGGYRVLEEMVEELESL